MLCSLKSMLAHADVDAWDQEPNEVEHECDVEARRMKQARRDVANRF